VPAAGGQVVARGIFAGELAEPRLKMTATVTNLKLPGGHTLTAADVSISGGAAAKEPLAVMIKVEDHRKGDSPLAIETATLIARGVTSDHTIELTGAMRSKQSLRVVANGGWKDRAWRGTLAGAESGQPFNLLVQKPVPVVIGLASLSVGPADFDLAGAHYSNVDLRRAEGRWHTAGAVDGLQPQARDSQARAPRRVVRTKAGDRIPLTLAGRWELELTDSITGIAVIERTGGDLYSGIDGLNPIGVSDVGAALNVVANRVTGNVYLRGRSLGKVDADIDAYLDPAMPEGRPLSQSRPFRMTIEATLPDLSWIGPLIGDSVQFGGKGSIHTIVSGTPADPNAQGTIKGEALRLAWVDQAVRLEDGRLDAVLEEGVLVLNELAFVGTPRVAPLDKRALEGLSTARPYEVRAVGRIALRSLTGSIGVTAQQLPVIQSEDRWMMVSGEGGITLTPERAELYGKLTVDGAYINFSGLRGQRSLPGDVVVVRKEKPAAAPVAPPIDIVIDVQGTLGERFYLEGAGLNARLAGQVQVTGRPGQLRAIGSVRAVDGVYNGYGQRLQIDRGIVTFQGPIDNPALNVLAVRTGLPVEVGVAIGGTAQRPVVRLHSDPSMSDAEKLNWLVLGRPPGASDGQDRALLSAAASALFAGQGDSASANLMRSLGIDQVTIHPGQDSTSLLPRQTVAGKLRSTGTSSTAVTDFVAIGKRINDDLSLSFEQALSGAEYFVALNYRLTNRLSLIARAGSTNALDLVYSFAFD
jgi:translocation and assembly module TamB